MRRSIVRDLLLIVYYLLGSLVAFGGQALLIEKGVALEWRLHYLFFVIHLFTLLFVITLRKVTRTMVGRFSIVVKIALILLVVYKFPQIKDHLFWYFGIYWYYLLLETGLEIYRVRQYDKSHK